MQEKSKARLRESRLLAPSSRGGGASSRNLAFDLSCMSEYMFKAFTDKLLHSLECAFSDALVSRVVSCLSLSSVLLPSLRWMPAPVSFDDAK